MAIDYPSLMREAIDLAKKGAPSPNPYVGCIILKGSKILGRGYHQKAGQPHAEINALRSCKEPPEGATLVVNLEPCSHFGKTPPCVDAILQSKIKEVVIATKDPNPLTAGKSIQKLENAGIRVIQGIERSKATELNRAFFKYIKNRMPYVSLKAAITLDGKIATSAFDSKWISCAESRAYTHTLRKQADAILIGANTLRKDNPRLTARTAATAYPARIILSLSGEIPRQSRIFLQQGKNIFCIPQDLKKEAYERLSEKGEILLCKRKEKGLDIPDLLQKLAEKEITHILVEGGSKIYTAFIEAGNVDRFYLIVAPKIAGGGISFIEDTRITKISETFQLAFQTIRKIGNDILITAKKG